MKRGLNIEIDSQINPTDLDLECTQQAHLFGLYSKEYADAVKKLAKVRQRLDNEYRRSWNPKDETGWNSSWGKPSESGIKSRIESSDDYIEAQHKVQTYYGHLRTMEQKKYALQNLIELAKLNWFSVPKVPLDLNRNFSKKTDEEEVNEKIHHSLNKKRKRK